MSNIATNLEQSRRLLELGLDPKSADMSWINSHDVDRWFLAPRTQGEIKGSLLEQELDEVEIIPAWSLSALLEVMPIKTTNDKKEYGLGIFPSGLFSTHSVSSAWTLHYYGRDFSYGSIDRYPELVSIKAHDLIDAAYEMVCWLLENGHIKMVNLHNNYNLLED